jgi:hypothetical protein
VGAVAFGIFLINGACRLISLLTQPDDDPLATVRPVETATDTVIGIVGMLLVVAWLAAAAAFWAVRHPVGRVVADLGAATIAGTLLALLIAPFLGGSRPFEEGLETFVNEFLMFLGLGALGTILGFTAMVVLGKDWKTRGLAAYTERYAKRAHRTGSPSDRRH